MHTRTRSEYKSFVILFIQNPISVSAIAKMCYCYCLMPTPTVEMSYAYKDEIWVQIICWFCLYPKPYYSPPHMSKCVIIIVWCQNRHSGDVICIQGRDLSTNHLLILFIQNPISSPITVRPVCQNVSWLLFDAITDIVEMSYAYKDEIWVQIICWFCLYPKPNFCQPCFLNCVMITVWCQNRHSGYVICIQGRDLSTNHLWLCLSKTLLQSAPYVEMCHYYCLMPSTT
jgi:hypothetical protein